MNTSYEVNPLQLVDTLAHEGIHSLQNLGNTPASQRFPTLYNNNITAFANWVTYSARSESDATIAQAEVDKDSGVANVLYTSPMAISTKWAYQNIINNVNISDIDPQNIYSYGALNSTHDWSMGTLLDNGGNITGDSYHYTASYMDVLGYFIGRNVQSSVGGPNGNYATSWASVGENSLKDYSTGFFGHNHYEFTGLANQQMYVDIYKGANAKVISAVVADLASSLITKDSNGNISAHIFDKNSNSATSKLILVDPNITVTGSFDGDLGGPVGTVSENPDYIVNVNDTSTTIPQATYSVGGDGNTGNFFMGTSYQAGQDTMTEYQIFDPTGQLQGGEFILENNGHSVGSVHLKDINEEALNLDGSVSLFAGAKTDTTTATTQFVVENQTSSKIDFQGYTYAQITTAMLTQQDGVMIDDPKSDTGQSLGDKLLIKDSNNVVTEIDMFINGPTTGQQVALLASGPDGANTVYDIAGGDPNPTIGLISATGQNNFLIGGNVTSTLIGSTGNDIFSAGQGNTTIITGKGDTGTIDLTYQTVGNTDNLVLSGYDTVTLGTANVSVTTLMTASAFISGGSGTVSVIGGGGSTSLDTNNSVEFRNGSHIVKSGAGSSETYSNSYGGTSWTQFTSAGSFSFSASSDNDAVYAEGGGVATIQGGSNNLFVNGLYGDKSETVIALGNSGTNDFLAGVGGNSLLYGGSGEAYMYAGGNGDVVYSGGSEGQFLYGSTDTSNWDLNGSAEVLSGELSQGDDNMNASVGNTIMIAGSGGDTFNMANPYRVGYVYIGVVKNEAGGQYSANGFITGTDKLVLAGFSDADIAGIQSSFANGALDSLALPDGSSFSFQDGEINLSDLRRKTSPFRAGIKDA